jgi:hypothetical protein
MPTVASVAARIRREGQPWFSRPARNTATIKAFVRGYQPDELVGDIQQGDRELHVAPTDLSWTPDQPDRVQIGDATAVVQTTETRTLGRAVHACDPGARWLTPSSGPTCRPGYRRQR